MKRKKEEPKPTRKPLTDAENAWGIVASMMLVMDQLGTRVPWPDEISRVEAQRVRKSLELWNRRLKTKIYLQGIAQILLDNQITTPDEQPKAS